ncbi:MAG: hypothetical protein KTR26_06495 [Flammeovirgaceae bacterium]|nr:hypothetical protein [Flammeovirgaceae bacterium]
MNKNIITLFDGKNIETWGSLKEVCNVYNLSHGYLMRLKFPFVYKGVLFMKNEFKKTNNIEFNNPKEIFLKGYKGTNMLEDYTKKYYSEG